VAFGPVAVITGTLAPIACFAMRAMVIIKQRCRARLDNQDYVAAAAAIATIWSTQGLELLTMNGDAAIATTSGASMQSDAIDKTSHGHPPSL
jgi:hypothetical protein